MDEETYYVNIREPAETRKKLLETSRQVVIALQKYESFKLKKMNKQDVAEKLRKNFKEINELIARLKKEMPQIPARKKIVLHEDKKTPQRISVPKGKRDIEDLERELGDIENKLKGLR